MIKKKTMLTALAAAGLAFTAISAQAATFTSGGFVKGDLLLGISASGGTGSGTVVYVNLGLATNFRDGNFSSINSVDISAVLDATYSGGTAGAWASRTDLYWGVVAMRTNLPGAGTGAQDPGLTIYVSKARTSGGTDGQANSTAWGPLSSSNMSTSGGQINTLEGSAGGSTLYASSTIIGTASTGATQWNNYNPQGAAGGASFVNFVSPTLGIEQAFGGSQTVGGHTVVGALDIYRVLNPASGTTTGAYDGTITLNSSGVLGAVPEPSTYALFGLGAVALMAFRRRLKNA